MWVPPENGIDTATHCRRVVLGWRYGAVVCPREGPGLPPSVAAHPVVAPTAQASPCLSNRKQRPRKCCP